MNISAITEIINRGFNELIDEVVDLRKEDEKRIQISEDLIRQVKELTETIKGKSPDAQAVSQKA